MNIKALKAICKAASAKHSHISVWETFQANITPALCLRLLLVVEAAQASVANPAWAGVCDEDILLARVLDELEKME